MQISHKSRVPLACSYKTEISYVSKIFPPILPPPPPLHLSRRLKALWKLCDPSHIQSKIRPPNQFTCLLQLCVPPFAFRTLARSERVGRDGGGKEEGCQVNVPQNGRGEWLFKDVSPQHFAVPGLLANLQVD